MSNGRNDFQNQSLVYFMNDRAQMPTPRGWWITPRNLIVMGIFVAVRHCIEATWLNDRDQFLYPTDGWQDDREFQLDCLVFTLFHGQNRISSKAGVNHWIPFTEDEVGCTSAFASHFMSDFLRGTDTGTPGLRKTGMPTQTELLLDQPLAADVPQAPYDVPFDSLSPESRAVFDAGRELWRYYHAQPGAVPDASLYDIRGHFQGFKPNGHMNADSPDAGYAVRIAALRAAVKALAAKITPEVYEHGFLRQ